MASHSASDTVDVAPANSAVSVVGTGVWLGARPDAILSVILLTSFRRELGNAQIAMLELSRREQRMRKSRLAPASVVGKTMLRPLPYLDLGSPHSLWFGNIHLQLFTTVTDYAISRQQAFP
jgi:hypothetical protein